MPDLLMLPIEIRSNGQSVALRPGESRILAAFMRQSDLNRADLERQLWPDGVGLPDNPDNTIRTTLSTLRSKIQPYGYDIIHARGSHWWKLLEPDRASRWTII